jgi:hypothetical protein
MRTRVEHVQVDAGYTKWLNAVDSIDDNGYR